jgi:hypothetical protein
MVTIRIDTRRNTSTNGMMSRSPGSRVPFTLPNLNSTPRSYCLIILNDIDPISRTTMTMATITILMISLKLGQWVRTHGQRLKLTSEPNGFIVPRGLAAA